MPVFYSEVPALYAEIPALPPRLHIASTPSFFIDWSQPTASFPHKLPAQWNPNMNILR